MGAQKKWASRALDDPVELAHVPLQAILLADSFTTKFRPITLERPKFLGLHWESLGHTLSPMEPNPEITNAIRHLKDDFIYLLFFEVGMESPLQICRSIPVDEGSDVGFPDDDLLQGWDWWPWPLGWSDESIIVEGDDGWPDVSGSVVIRVDGVDHGTVDDLPVVIMVEDLIDGYCEAVTSGGASHHGGGEPCHGGTLWKLPSIYRAGCNLPVEFLHGGGCDSGAFLASNLMSELAPWDFCLLLPEATAA